MKTNKALTVIELLVVVSIVGMLIATGYSAFLTFNGDRDGSVTVIQFGERHRGKMISEDPNSVTIKTYGGRTITVTQPYVIYK